MDTLTKQVGSVLTYGFFSASTNGVLVYQTSRSENQLTWFDQRGKRLGTIGEPATYATVALSPDGARAVVSRLDVLNPHLTLWLMDLGRGTSTRFTFGRFGTASAPNGIWSPDGSRVFFSLGPPR